MKIAFESSKTISSKLVGEETKSHIEEISLNSLYNIKKNCFNNFLLGFFSNQKKHEQSMLKQLKHDLITYGNVIKPSSIKGIIETLGYKHYFSSALFPTIHQSVEQSNITPRDKMIYVISPLKSLNKKEVWDYCRHTLLSYVENKNLNNKDLILAIANLFEPSKEDSQGNLIECTKWLKEIAHNSSNSLMDRMYAADQIFTLERYHGKEVFDQKFVGHQKRMVEVIKLLCHLVISPSSSTEEMSKKIIFLSISHDYYQDNDWEKEIGVVLGNTLSQLLEEGELMVAQYIKGINFCFSHITEEMREKATALINQEKEEDDDFVNAFEKCDTESKKRKIKSVYEEEGRDSDEDAEMPPAKKMKPSFLNNNNNDE